MANFVKGNFFFVFALGGIGDAYCVTESDGVNLGELGELGELGWVNLGTHIV